MVSVRGVLSLAPLKRGVPELLAGEASLDRELRWVHAAEVPNIASLLKGGELLLTTGMGIGPGEADQRRFVAELAERGVAGVVIELGGAFDDLPEPLVAEARARDLPLIALHRQVRFVEITEAVHAEIVNRQVVVMRRGDQIHRRFTDLMLEGAGIAEVLAELAAQIANPVLLEKAQHGILYHAVHAADDAEVLAARDAVRRGIAEAPASLFLPVPMEGHETWGHLVALAVDSPLGELERVAVERAVALIALALIRSRQEELLGARERGNFLASLVELEGELDETEASARAAAMGFEHGRSLLPVAVGSSAPLDSDEPAWALVWRDVRRGLERERTPVIAGIRAPERDILMVVGIASPERRAEAADHVAAVIHDAVARHFGEAKAGVVVCVGPRAPSWAGVRDGLRETARAAPAALHAPARPWHDVTRADLRRLLWALRDSQQLHSFVRRRLERLVEHDRQRAAKLLPTLEAYYAHDGRKAETARALNLERQSLYDRLRRIEDLLGEDLAGEETRLGLHLALSARRYLGEAEAGDGASR